MILSYCFALAATEDERGINPGPGFDTEGVLVKAFKVTGC